MARLWLQLWLSTFHCRLGDMLFPWHHFPPMLMAFVLVLLCKRRALRLSEAPVNVGCAQAESLTQSPRRSLAVSCLQLIMICCHAHAQQACSQCSTWDPMHLCIANSQRAAGLFLQAFSFFPLFIVNFFFFFFQTAISSTTSYGPVLLNWQAKYLS